MNTRQQFLAHLEERFTAFFQSATKIAAEQAIKGGDINQCFLLETDKGKFFIKINASIFGLDFFEKEARGLVELANAGVIKVPRPLFDGKFHQQIYLVIEYMEKGAPPPDFWTRFGQSIAALHHCTRDQFGLDYPNYIGRLHQSNHAHDAWTDFFTEERILPLARKAMDRSLLTREDMALAEKLCLRLADRIPAEPPSLLHGDLWTGNVMAQQNGQPAIFDPAIYYGHREMDLAMAKLFGGFDDTFFEAYREASPLLPGWEERIDLFQLYPLLVHLLLFGGGYREQVTGTLRKYGT